MVIERWEDEEGVSAGSDSVVDAVNEEGIDDEGDGERDDIENADTPDAKGKRRKRGEE